MEKKALILVCTLIVCPAFADSVDPYIGKTNRYFSSIKSAKNPALNQFLEKMPKGADLHNHFTGAIYPEWLISYAQNDPAKPSWCVIPPIYNVKLEPKCHENGGILLSEIKVNSTQYNTIISAWSTKNFPLTPPLYGHDHFFAAFGKIRSLLWHYKEKALAQMIKQAEQEHIDYLELMNAPKEAVLAANSYTQYITKILPADPNKITYEDVVAAIAELNRHNFQDNVVKKLIIPSFQNLLSSTEKSGVVVRFQYSVTRINPFVQVFTNLYAAFSASKLEPNLFVGLNMVGPEDDATALADHHAQMLLIRYFDKYFKDAAHINLHEGELTDRLPTIQKDPSAMTFHVAEAVNLAGAERIGHGVDLFYELPKHPDLIQQMKKNHRAVEINLVSNEVILGVCDGESYCEPPGTPYNPPDNYKFKHPFIFYFNKGVPVVLSTDDQGILYADLTKEYFLAATRYSLNYSELKKISENGIIFSFLPGKHLWNRVGDYRHFVPVCAKDNPYTESNPSPKCQAYLQNNLKAKLEWNLEKHFSQFESQR